MELMSTTGPIITTTITTIKISIEPRLCLRVDQGRIKTLDRLMKNEDPVDWDVLKNLAPNPYGM